VPITQVGNFAQHQSISCQIALPRIPCVSTVSRERVALSNCYRNPISRSGRTGLLKDHQLSSVFVRKSPGTFCEALGAEAAFFLSDRTVWMRGPTVLHIALDDGHRKLPKNPSISHSPKSAMSRPHRMNKATTLLRQNGRISSQSLLYLILKETCALIRFQLECCAAERIGVNALVKGDQRLWENTNSTNSLVPLLLAHTPFRALSHYEAFTRNTQVELAADCREAVEVIVIETKNLHTKK
jgi:hypothetical protein